jgi:hypothetical protein
MTVNSSTEVQNLNADLLNGKSASDFLGRFEAASNSNLLDGKDSTAFASGVNGKATDADKLDGKSAEAFLRKSFDYHNRQVFLEAGATETIVAECLPGQVAVSGGYTGVEPGTHVFTSIPALTSDGVPPNGWRIIVERKSTSGEFVSAFVACVNP